MYFILATTWENASVDLRTCAPSEDLDQPALRICTGRSDPVLPAYREKMDIGIHINGQERPRFDSIGGSGSSL